MMITDPQMHENHPQKAEEHPKKAKYGQNAQKTQKTRFLKKLQSSDFFETCSKIS